MSSLPAGAYAVLPDETRLALNGENRGWIYKRQFSASANYSWVPVYRCAIDGVAAPVVSTAGAVGSIHVSYNCRG